MKIEKISDNQIKLTLTRADLQERNINLEELIKPSEKTQELFKDIMEQAFDECGFSFENQPLMVEAAPVSVDGLIIIVTKIPEKESQEDKLSLITQNKDLRRFMKKSVAHYTPENNSDEGICIFSFSDLNEVSSATDRISSIFKGFSSLYKLHGKYFLLLQSAQPEDLPQNEKIDLILGEYGQKHVSGVLSKYHLYEYGEIIVKQNAINIMSQL